MKTIYLDHSSSTPVAASVRDSMLPYLNEFYGHPSQSHWFGRASFEAIEDARSHVASLLGCHPSEIIFTSGGTESVNIGLLGIASAIQPAHKAPHLICSNLEHSCVAACVEHLEKLGWESSLVCCNEQGSIDVDELEKLIQPNTRLISIIHANHHFGSIQPIAEISDLCQEKDILLHTDAAQTIGKIPCNVDELGVDLLSLSGHKMFAPKGIGALYVRTGVPISPMLFGDGCEAGLRPGTANVPAIVGLGTAAKLVDAGLETTQRETADRRDRFIAQLEKCVGRPITIHAENGIRLPNLASFEIPGVASRDIRNLTPEICFGPCYESCQTGKSDLAHDSHLNPLGLSEESLASTLRIAIGWTTSEDELQKAAEMIASAYESLVR
ncbi:MAG: cysteine desulfurase family protein [Aureliella sp.]